MADDRPSATEESGTYQVWHSSGESYTPVALVHTGNLLGATVFTISRKDAHWQDGDRVTALVTDGRSTDIGDVIVCPEGVAYEIEATHHGLVFQPIDFPPLREQAAIFAEWTQDYTAAAERDQARAIPADHQRHGRTGGAVTPSQRQPQGPRQRYRAVSRNRPSPAYFEAKR